jgi:hypothetical protein
VFRLKNSKEGYVMTAIQLKVIQPNFIKVQDALVSWNPLKVLGDKKLKLVQISNQDDAKVCTWGSKPFSVAEAKNYYKNGVDFKFYTNMAKNT